MSFWKHEPPKPTDALRNLGPMRESVPMACATCDTSADALEQAQTRRDELIGQYHAQVRRLELTLRRLSVLRKDAALRKQLDIPRNDSGPSTRG